MIANRHGDYGTAKRLLTRVADRIAGYAGQDAVLRELEAALLQDAVKYGTVMDGRAQKEAYYTSTASLRGRTATGSATRSRNRNEAEE